MGEHNKFEAILGYMVRSRPAQTSWQDPASKHKHTKKLLLHRPVTRVVLSPACRSRVLAHRRYIYSLGCQLILAASVCLWDMVTVCMFTPALS